MDLNESGDYAVYTACGLEVKNGEVSSINMKPQTSFIRIKKDTVFPGYTGGSGLTIYWSGLHYQFRGKDGTCETEERRQGYPCARQI